MASSYSIARTYNTFVPPVNLELLANAMTSKQQKYDSNYAAITSQLTAYGSEVDLAKAEDRQYFYDRAKKLLDDVNSLGAVDLSSKAVTTKIQNHLGQLIDSNVQNAITSTANVRKFQADMATLKEKNPDKYSVVNEMYALRPYMQWMNDGKAGTLLGQMRYTNYQDVQAKFNKRIKEVTDAKGTRKFQIRDGKGGLIEREYTGLDESDIRSIIENEMTPDERMQLAINGWYDLGQASPQQANQILNGYASSKLKELEGDIQFISKAIEDGTGNTEENKKKAENLLVQKAELIDKFTKLSGGSTEQIGEFMQKEKLFEAMKSSYDYEIKSETFKSDEAYFDRANLSLAEANYQLSVRRADTADFEAQTNRMKLEFDMKKENLGSFGTGVNANTNLPANISVVNTVKDLSTRTETIGKDVSNIVNDPTMGFTKEQIAVFNASTNGDIGKQIDFIMSKGTDKMRKRLIDSGIPSNFEQVKSDKARLYNSAVDLSEAHLRATGAKKATLVEGYAQLMGQERDPAAKAYYSMLISSLGYDPNKADVTHNQYFVSLSKKGAPAGTMTMNAESIKKYENEGYKVKVLRTKSSANKKFVKEFYDKIKYANEGNRETFEKAALGAVKDVEINKTFWFAPKKAASLELTRLVNSSVSQVGNGVMAEDKTIFINKSPDGKNIEVYQYAQDSNKGDKVFSATLPVGVVNEKLKALGYDLEKEAGGGGAFTVAKTKRIQGRPMIDYSNGEQKGYAEAHGGKNFAEKIGYDPKDSVVKESLSKAIIDTKLGKKSVYELYSNAGTYSYDILPTNPDIPSLGIRVQIRDSKNDLLSEVEVPNSKFTSEYFNSISAYPQQILKEYIDLELSRKK